MYLQDERNFPFEIDALNKLYIILKNKSMYDLVYT